MAKAKSPKPTPEDLTTELIMLVKEQIQSQRELLQAALETQKAQAETLSKWISMFTPQPGSATQ